MPKAKTKIQGSFVLLSDLHAHAWSAFAKGEGADNSRLRRSLEVLDQSLAKARELNLPWVFAGDIVHTAGYALNVVLGGLTEVLLLYPDVVKIAVWGNHDARGIGGKIQFGQTVLATLSKVVPQFHVLDPSLQSEPFVAGGISFSGAGYQPRGDYLQYGCSADVGVYHQTVRGTKAPNGFVLEEGIEAAELTKRHRVAVIGHVHHWQYHPATKGDKMVLIPGSPEHQNFGDMGDHGWWLVTLPPVGPAVASYFEGGSPKFLTVDAASQVKKDGNFYRVSGNMAGQALPAGAIAIGSAPTSVSSRDILQGARGEAALSAWLKSEPPKDSDLSIDRYLEAGKSLLSAYEIGNLRPLTLSTIKIKNFCSYADQTVFVKPGTWLVMGRGRDFPSNGAGKSTLFEAVFWALFGRTTKGLTGDEVIRWGTDDCEVTVAFADGDDQTLCVTRTRGKHSRLIVTTEEGQIEAKSVNELTEKLGQYMGITPELYQALGYFSQEKLLLFASATDGERKDMLADLIGLGAYQEAATAANAKLSELEVGASKTAAVVESTTRQRDAESKRLAAMVAQEKEWRDDWTVRSSKADQAMITFADNMENLRIRMVLETRQQMGQYLDQRKVAAQAKLDAALAAPVEIVSTPEELMEAQLSHSRAMADVKSVRALITENERQITAVKNKLLVQEAELIAGKCPSCGQAITPEHQARCLNPLREELEGLLTRKSTLEQQQNELLPIASNFLRACSTHTAGVEAYKRKEATTKQRGDAEAELAKIDQELEAIEVAAGLQVDATLSAKQKELSNAVLAIRAEKNPLEREILGSKDRLDGFSNELITLEENSRQVREWVAIYEYWKRGFSKQGIQSLLVDEVAGLFNAVRGSIFPALTQGVYDVQFSTVSQTRQGEWREKTEFQVFEHGTVVPYAALSGGQRRRVDVGVMLTLVKAVSRWMQVPGMLGLLVLDEVFGFLDGSGAEGLMEALREMQEQIPAIFVVSHEPQLQALFPEVIIVEQGEDGVSRLVSESGA